MEQGKRRAGWPLGEHLLDRGFALAFEDPAMAIRLTRLGLRLSALLARGYDPFSPSPRPKKTGRRGKGKKRRS